MVPTATPIMEIRDRTVMKFRFFLLRKYREAIKNERFKLKGINFPLPHLLPELLECSDQRSLDPCVGHMPKIHPRKKQAQGQSLRFFLFGSPDSSGWIFSPH